MGKLKIYCLSLNPKHLNLIKKIGYEPVGLGDLIFNKEWINDKEGNSIHYKNSNYGEYTFHYSLWKNQKINFDGWIGFCQYRKFWANSSGKTNYDNKLNDFYFFNQSLLKEIPSSFESFDTILTEELYINKFRFFKFMKHNFKKMFFNPELIFNKKKRTIKFHFDMWHGEGNLDKAVNKLPHKEKEDFKYFVNTEVSFNSQNMFICKNKELLFSYYDSLFPWLLDCEKIFGFDDLKNYGLKRIYAFLAERYCSYWFKKYSKYKTLPFIFKDITDFL